MTIPVCVGVEWINTFHSGACNQNNLSYRDDHAEGFYNHMDSHGHLKIFHWGNDNAWETDLRHPTSAATRCTGARTSTSTTSPTTAATGATRTSRSRRRTPTAWPPRTRGSSARG